MAPDRTENGRSACLTYAPSCEHTTCPTWTSEVQRTLLIHDIRPIPNRFQIAAILFDAHTLYCVLESPKSVYQTPGRVRTMSRRVWGRVPSARRAGADQKLHILGTTC